MGAPKFGDLDWEAIRAERNAAKDEEDEDEDEEEEEVSSFLQFQTHTRLFLVVNFTNLLSTFKEL